MTLFLHDADLDIYCGDALETLRVLPDESVHMSITSPPFYGLRDYGTGEWEGGEEGCDHVAVDTVRTPWANSRPGPAGQDGKNAYSRNETKEVGGSCGKCGARRVDRQLGLEATPAEWVANLVDVFREVRRVLRPDGTLWVECGDSYVSDGKLGRDDADRLSAGLTGGHGGGKAAPRTGTHKARARVPGLKTKDLIGAPWRLALGLQDDGWWLRSEIIWDKRNPMPESVRDRPTLAHSRIFLFAKSLRYYYDPDAVREPAEWSRWGDQTVPKYDGHDEAAGGWIKHRSKEEVEELARRKGGGGRQRSTGAAAARYDGNEFKNTEERNLRYQGAEMHPLGRNLRTVWSIPTEPSSLAICAVCDAFWDRKPPKTHCGQKVVQHFAAFPQALVERPVKAGTSERGVCSACGAPWVRIVEELPDPFPGSSHDHSTDDELVGGKGRTREDGLPVGTVIASRRDRSMPETVGWEPACECQAGVVPATVLDPFAGSGTTGLVARRLGRRAILLDLSEPYCRLMRHRLAQLPLDLTATV